MLLEMTDAQMKSPSKATPTKQVQKSLLSFFSTPQPAASKSRISDVIDIELSSSPSISKKFRILDDDDEEESLANCKRSQDDFPLSQESLFSLFSSPSQGTKSDISNHYVATDVKTCREPIAQDKQKEETRYHWLIDVKDKDGNPPSHPNYNPKTLLIPSHQWKTFTPFEKQYWEIKSSNYDCLVFFKKGKFYELYESDADVGAREFDFKMTDRVNMRMAGVPEGSFDYWAAKFIAKGYKIAKVDQVESGIGKELREQNAEGEKDKIIKRELSCILTAGTAIDASILTSDLANFCLCLKFSNELPTGEKTANAKSSSTSEFAVLVSATFVETSTGKFYLCSSFLDDERQFSQLETLIAQIRPREIVSERKGVPPNAMKMIKNSLFNPLFSFLDGAFPTVEKVKTRFQEKNYFSQMPSVLAQAFESDSFAAVCFGGLVEYLSLLKLDVSLLSFGAVLSYSVKASNCYLEIDGQTLLNLEIFQNSSDGSDEGTLIHLLDKCLTAFGKRMLRFWVSHPLSQASQINERLDAVEELVKNSSLAFFIEDSLGKVPDFERIACRIHTKSCKLSDFITTLEKWKVLLEKFANNSDCKESLKKDGLPYRLLFEQFPLQSLSAVIDEFSKAFNWKVALAESSIIPFPGAYPEYDRATEEVSEIERELNAYLEEQKKRFACRDIQYRDLGKELFQLEIPVAYCENISSEFVAMSKTKSVYRYWTPTIKALVKRFQHAVEKRRSATQNIYSHFLQRYDSHSSILATAISVLSQIDCIYSLYKASTSFQQSATKPQIIPHYNGESSLSIKQSIHPCVRDCIPNDISIGPSECSPSSPQMILLTGPNMGGKSTLLRQVCIQTILAQIGCFCPAQSMTLAPFTKIFTRIGANDNIMNGQSTFMVERNETSRILRNADERSLVILDELGRGTGTYDGYAIAYATLHYLLNYVRTRGLFSTHYHMLGKEMQHYSHLSQCHMGYIVAEGSSAENGILTAANCSVLNDRVVFLYQLTEGACNESFGMNVARMAGVPHHIIQRAQCIADKFERESILKTASSNSISVAHIIDEQFLSKNSQNISHQSLSLIERTMRAFSQ